MSTEAESMRSYTVLVVLDAADQRETPETGNIHVIFVTQWVWKRMRLAD